MDTASLFSTGFWHRSLDILGERAWGVAQVVIFFLLVRFLAYRLINRVMNSMAAREQTTTHMTSGRVLTLGSLIKSIIFYVLVFICGVMILREFKLDPSPVLTAAGVVGLAVGFGAQKLVRDVFSGFFIVLENQYSVGDNITIGTVTGTVEELGMRITKLRDDVGKLVIIPNGEIGQVTNHSRGPLIAAIDISVDPKTDPAVLRDAINSAGEEVMLNVEGVLNPPMAKGIIALDATKMTMRVSCEVTTGRQWAVQTSIREAIRAKLIEAGIELAYEQAVKQV